MKLAISATGLVLCLSLTPVVPVHATDPASTICGRTADLMQLSCRAETREELRASIASCIDLADNEARRHCREEARTESVEQASLCGEQRSARLGVCELLGEDRYDPDPLSGVSASGEQIEFVDPAAIGFSIAPNPYLSLERGHTHVLRAGEDFEESVIVTVTDEVRDILGVPCRVVVDVVVIEEDDEYVAVEVTDDWFAQSTTGDVYYCGEIARNFEDDVLRDLDGSFEAGRDFAKSGVLIKAAPAVGDAHRQEFLLGEAEDVIRYVDTAAVPGDEEGGENPRFPCAPAGCLKTEEFIPTEPEAGEFKYYQPGIGFVLGVALEDGEITGERDELVCMGNSLSILDDVSCGFADPSDLLEDLCELSPEAFCDDD